jgi:hypothetical protein
MTIESKTADTILQRESSVEIAGETYHVSPPSVATLILVSELIAQVPHVNPVSTLEEKMMEAIKTARHCHVLGSIAATLILGARDVLRRRNSILPWRRNPVKRLSAHILMHQSPRELSHLISLILSRMEIKDFFELTSSLSEVSITKPTKEEVKTTTSGQ